MIELIIIFVVMMILGMMLGFTLSLPATPIFCLLRKIFYVPFIRKRLQEEAEKHGHVVSAKLMKKRRSSRPGHYYYGTYEYEYMGKKYKTTTKGCWEPPKERDLYFLRNPKHACPKDRLGEYEDDWKLYYLYLSVISGIIFGLIGTGYIFTVYL